MLRTVEQLLRGYEPYQIVIEVTVIWMFVYLAFRFLRGTRGGGIIKGLAVLLVILTVSIKTLGQFSETFGRLDFLYDKFLAVLAIFLIVVFQPELRQAMNRLGQLFQRRSLQVDSVVDAVHDAVEFLSKSQFGALIAIERDVRLGGLLEGGIQLDAEVSSSLLRSIFWPNNPLHDLGVVVRENRVVAAGVQFPLAEDGTLPAELGSRHRAAIGVTLDSDCVVVVVSEETGAVSIADRGQLTFDIPRDRLRQHLASRLEGKSPPPPLTGSPKDRRGTVAARLEDVTT